MSLEASVAAPAPQCPGSGVSSTGAAARSPGCRPGAPGGSRARDKNRTWPRPLDSATSSGQKRFSDFSRVWSRGPSGSTGTNLDARGGSEKKTFRASPEAFRASSGHLPGATFQESPRRVPKKFRNTLSLRFVHRCPTSSKIGFQTVPRNLNDCCL